MIRDFKPKVIDNKKYIKDMCIKGMKVKGCYDDSWYHDRLEEELDVILGADLEDFFLNTAYICALIDEADIFRGPARGSCLASVVCYFLNITKIDPKPYNLSFARFLNKTRIQRSLPDIDTDVSSDGRDDVLNLIREHFGEDRCGQVLNKVNFTPKVLIKDLSARLGLDFAQVNKVTSFLSNKEDDYHNNKKIMEFLDKNPQVRDYIDPLTGITKNYGVHAGAMIILDDTMDKYCSVINVSGKPIISNNGSECNALGFLKNDTLGIKVLDVQRDCLNLIKDNVDLPYEFDDPKVYESICKNPMGLFQLEKAAGRTGVKMVQPENFNELMALVSLIRPGARNSGMDKLYADYKFGRKEPEYLDERLKDTLGGTQGLMIFQEDAMAVARDLAGMSDVETDNLRKAISKKKKEAFDIFKPKFINGCIDNNVNEEVAKKLWDNIEKSSDYSFNRAHACGYAVLAYQSAFLKTYYPLEFAVAMLQNIKNDEEEKRIEILNMIKDSDAELCPPDINLSETETTIVDNKIYIGLNIVNSISDKVSTAILKERANGDFESFDNFCQRIAPRECNKRCKENLIGAGAFDFGLTDMQDIIDKRGELFNFLKKGEKGYEERIYTKKEILDKEFSAISFSIREEYIDSVKTPYDTMLTPLLNATDEDNEEMYVKGVIIDVDNQQGYSILHLQNKDVNQSISCSEAIIAKYGDYFETGHIIIAKCHCYDGKLYMHFLIDYSVTDPFMAEEAYINGTSYQLITSMPASKKYTRKALVKQATYFISKKGNKCLRLSLMEPEGPCSKITCKSGYNILPQGIVAGMFIEYKPSKNSDTFINAVKQTYI